MTFSEDKKPFLGLFDFLVFASQQNWNVKWAGRDGVFYFCMNMKIVELGLCGCGCKTPFTKKDVRGRERTFIHGHNGRKEGSGERRAARKRNYAKFWYRENRERVLERNAHRREYRREYNKSYARNNPEKMRHKAKVRRALQAGARGSHTFDQWIARVVLFGWKCRYCHSSLSPATVTKDHQIALTKGGSEWPSNLVPACRRCNSLKNTRGPIEFRRMMVHG